MPLFGSASQQHLSGAHPLLQKLMNTAIGRATSDLDFMILDSQRGRDAQERAFAAGNSKVHFGNSAHNWQPSVALDVCPYPVDWSDRQRFMDLGLKLIMPIAKELGIPIRWGADFNMDGNYTNDSFVDLPHYELYPWRSFAAKDCQPYAG